MYDDNDDTRSPPLKALADDGGGATVGSDRGAAAAAEGWCWRAWQRASEPGGVGSVW